MSANTTLNILASEADSLLDQAKRYRVAMDALPEGDPKRAVYEQMIRDLLD